MAPPALECKGCDFKVKTESEPASDAQVEAMFNKAARHSFDESGRIDMNMSKVAVPALGKVTKEELDTQHVPDFEYHPITPAKGFEDAKVVGKTQTPPGMEVVGERFAQKEKLKAPDKSLSDPDTDPLMPTEII